MRIRMLRTKVDIDNNTIPWIMGEEFDVDKNTDNDYYKLKEINGIMYGVPKIMKGAQFKKVSKLKILFRKLKGHK